MKFKLFIIISLILIPLTTRGDQSLIQTFLIRSNYLNSGNVAKANNYRIHEYTSIRNTTFMGKNIMLHEKVIGPLKCVEKKIKATCSDNYTPKVLSGWRPNNTIQGAEISNHVFGIAIDIDPSINTCCGCVKDWAKAEGCKNAVKPDDGSAPLGTYEIPRCWIDSFNEYGWYWLGDEPTLRDTMHFEFLAKPVDVSCD